MKKELVLMSMLLWVGLFCLPKTAFSGGGYGMGWMMSGQDYGDYDLSEEEQKRVKDYRKEIQDYYKGTAEQRQKIWTRQHEMRALLVNPSITKEELLQKQKEIQEHMNDLNRKELSFRWELDKKYPELAPDIYGGCFGPAMGFGGGMMEYENTPWTPRTDSDQYIMPHMRHNSYWGNWRRWQPWKKQKNE